jgi:hypothetical protein
VLHITKERLQRLNFKGKARASSEDSDNDSSGEDEKGEDDNDNDNDDDEEEKEEDDDDDNDEEEDDEEEGNGDREEEQDQLDEDDMVVDVPRVRGPRLFFLFFLTLFSSTLASCATQEHLLGVPPQYGKRPPRRLPARLQVLPTDESASSRLLKFELVQSATAACGHNLKQPSKTSRTTILSKDWLRCWLPWATRRTLV